MLTHYGARGHAVPCSSVIKILPKEMSFRNNPRTQFYPEMMINTKNCSQYEQSSKLKQKRSVEVIVKLFNL